ncbi:MAG: cytochrome c family protein [Polyangiaceae bacterium]
MESNIWWLVLFLVTALGSCSLTQAYKSIAGVVRGYTFLGVLLGLLATALFFSTFFFSLRKRTLQESKVFGHGSMMAWMSAHVWLGLLALLVAWAHAGNGVFSFNSSTGKTLFGVMAFVVVSGIVWRLAYVRVPPQAAREVGNYNKSATEDRSAELLTEIEKLSAGRSTGFRDLKLALLEGRELNEPALTAIHQALPTDELDVFSEVSSLIRERRKELAKLAKQTKFTERLQLWRATHVPLGLILVILIPLHVCGACDVPSKVIPVGALPNATLGGLHSADDCAQCHKEIVQQWRHSMHAHAMTSPVMVVQNNQVAALILKDAPSPDPKKICVNCHGPVGSNLNSQVELPFSGFPLGDSDYVNEGVTCAACHQWNGTPVTGGGGLAQWANGLKPGSTFFGPRDDAVGNAYHSSEKIPLFDNPDQLCRNCHVVAYDTSGDGRIVKGQDLVLQQLFDEWTDYRAAGNPGTCVSCHMPFSGSNRAASNAWPLFEADGFQPKRAVRDHSFVGVDYPINISPNEDPHRGKRLALLASAGTISVTSAKNLGSAVSFNVTISNTGTGHNLPSGFAFVRQMFVEVRIVDSSGQLVGGSGVLFNNTDDLCDSTTMDDPTNPVRQFVQGCQQSDPQLVSFQQLLLDRITPKVGANGQVEVDARGDAVLAKPEGAVEVVIQHTTSGAVSRVRPFDRKPVKPIPPGQSSTFGYNLPVRGTPAQLTVSVKMRALPPYFLRALAAGQKSGKHDLRDYVKNCSADTMFSQTVRL